MDDFGDEQDEDFDETTYEQHYAREVENDKRRRHRLRSVAARHLPDWAPDAFVDRFIALLLEESWRRKSERSENPAWDASCCDGLCWPTLIDEDSIAIDFAMLRRLCNYHADMRQVWETVERTPIVHQRWARQAGHAGAAGVLLVLLDTALVAFSRLPKRTAATRRSGLTKAAAAIEKAVAAIKADPEAAQLCRPAVLVHFAAKNAEMRLANGDAVDWTEAYVPSLAFRSTGGIQALDVDPVPPWHQWSEADRYRWITGEIESACLVDVLTECVDQLRTSASEKPPVLQPGRDDGGLFPFLAREMSRVMRWLYGKPLDDTLALVLSAVLNTSEPLTRDGIRPYLKFAKL